MQMTSSIEAYSRVISIERIFKTEKERAELFDAGNNDLEMRDDRSLDQARQVPFDEVQ